MLPAAICSSTTIKNMLFCSTKRLSEISKNRTNGCPLSDCLFQVATEKDNGILLYKDDHDPLALELYQGHIRLIYDITNYPPTTVYR